MHIMVYIFWVQYESEVLQVLHVDCACLYFLSPNILPRNKRVSPQLGDMVSFLDIMLQVAGILVDRANC